MFRASKRGSALSMAVLLLVIGASMAMADATLIHDDFRAYAYSNDLNTDSGIRQYSATGIAPVPFIDNRNPANGFEMALVSTVPEAVSMFPYSRTDVTPPGDNPVVFSFDQDWKSNNSIRVYTRMIPGYHRNGMLNAADTWAGFAFAGGALKAAGVADAVSFKISKNGNWAAYNYSTTPFASGTISGVTDPAVNGLEYNLRALLRKVGSEYRVSFSIRSRVYDDLSLETGWSELTEIVPSTVVAGSFAANYTSWSGGISETWPYQDTCGFTDVIVEEVTTAIPGSLGGHLDLENYDGAPQAIATRVQFHQGTDLIFEDFVKLNAAGDYMVNNVPPGLYNVTFKPGQFLPKVVQNVTISTNTTTDCDVTVLNGDVDGDGTVTTTDLSATILNMDQ